ncbi:hypothetical protein COO60DRAFT_1512630, partial [Scenedesmus sp. NREL 46B-D3]
MPAAKVLLQSLYYLFYCSAALCLTLVSKVVVAEAATHCMLVWLIIMAAGRELVRTCVLTYLVWKQMAVSVSRVNIHSLVAVRAALGAQRPSLVCWALCHSAGNSSVSSAGAAEYMYSRGLQGCV